MNCPMCGLPEKYLRDDPDNEMKSRCIGCKAKFFNKDKIKVIKR